MSRGPGLIQRKLLAVLKANPKRMFTMQELTERAYPGSDNAPAQVESARRALKVLPVTVYHERRPGKQGRVCKYLYKAPKKTA